MQINIDDGVIAEWKERAKEEGEKADLTAERLKEMVEDFLLDYFS